MPETATPAVKTTLNIRGRLLSLAEPVVMGVVNTTPDSFYKDSRAITLAAVLMRAERMLNEGAAILDIGGFSTRPGAVEISEEAERKRVIPVVEALVREFPEAIISIDTFRSGVAAAALDAGAGMVNDITAGSDPAMAALVGRHRVPYIIMHMRLPVTDMMANTHYDDLLGEMLQYFAERLQHLHSQDIFDVIIDPGFGFSKTMAQNYEILKNLTYFEALGVPILAGVSRKSMIYKLLETSPDEALNGTSVVNFIALQNGARILRVHDVKAAVETIKIYRQLSKSDTGI